MLYPLKFKPVYKDYIWGGRRLSRLGKALPAQGIVAESWEISCHPNGVSVIANGSLAGTSLPDAIGRFGRLLLGRLLPEQTRHPFPLLVKLIDANDRLSIQVHPDDSIACAYESGDAGKSEMWYVVEAEPGACLIAGLQPGATRETLAEALADGSLDIFRKLPVKAGDAVNIPAGLVHAIGEGLVICEIQQSSDVTYRLSDYGRRDPQGRERTLHLQKGLSAVDYQLAAQSALTGLILQDPGVPGLVRRILVLNRHFCTEELRVSGEAHFLADGSRFMTLTIIGGLGQIEYEGASLPVAQGESVLIPACLGEWRLTGSLQLIAGQVSDFAADLHAIAVAAGIDPAGGLQKVIGELSGTVGFLPLPDFS